MRERRYGGFTLIEVLLATTLVSTVLVAAYSLYRTGIDATRRAEAAADRSQEARQLFRLLRADLEGAYKSGSAFDTGFTAADEGSAPAETDSLQCMAQGLAPRIDGEPLPGLTWVSWSIGTDEFGERRGLVRDENRILNEFIKEQDAEYVPPVVAADVTALNFRFFDGTDWFDAWDTTRETLPRRVEVTVRFAAEVDGESEVALALRTFRTVFLVPLADDGSEEQQ